MTIHTRPDPLADRYSVRSYGSTLADLIEFARTNWPHLEWTAREIYQLGPIHSTELVKVRLENFQRREALKKDMSHWSYCRNRDVTTRQFLALIEEYERSASQADREYQFRSEQ